MGRFPKGLYYAGVRLEEDQKFCALVAELKASPEVFITNEAEHELVHVCDYDANGYDYHETGETYEGYYYHYVSFIYRGFGFHIEPSMYYPFTDENYPGMFNFIPYVPSLTGRRQADYFNAYEGLSSLDKWIEKGRYPLCNEPVKPLYDQFQGCMKSVQAGVASITMNKGGFREKSILPRSFTRPTETWSDDHKVVEVLSLYPDADGHRDSYMVDLVTRTICG